MGRLGNRKDNCYKWFWGALRKYLLKACSLTFDTSYVCIEEFPFFSLDSCLPLGSSIVRSIFNLFGTVFSVGLV